MQNCIMKESRMNDITLQQAVDRFEAATDDEVPIILRWAANSILQLVYEVENDSV